MSISVTSLAIKVTSEGIKEASAQLSGISTSANNATTRINSFTAAMEKLNAISRTSSAGMDSYMTKLREQASLFQSLNLNARGAAVGTEALAAAMALLAGSLVIINQRLQQNEINHRRNNEAMREAQALSRGLAGSLGALWVTYGNFAGMAVGLAIGASLKGIISVGIDVEHTLEGIRVRGNETVESISNLRKVVYDLGTSVYGPQQVAKALETLVLAGLNATQAANAVGAALNLATVGGTTIEKSASTLVSVGSAIGYVAEGYGRVGDVIAKTAALSMASVESLSEGFKSASSVNKLYGVSLEDIGTSLGVLSNLGITNTAGGTALKNMYKELASEATKVGSTLKDIGLTQASFKDSAGNFLPLLDVVGKLDGALKQLSEPEQKLAIARLSNERGMRLLVQVLGEYNVKLADGSSALDKFQKDVTNSYGFAAKGAVQMALTSKSQVDSMFNTLKEAFAETFKDIEPQLIGFSSRMKAIFSSQDFKNSLITLAEAFARVAVSIADNLPLIAKLVLGFTAIKVAVGIGALLEAVAVGLVAINAALNAVAAGTVTLAVAMPALTAVLGIAAAAWATYHFMKGDDNPTKAKENAENYSKGYIEGLTKEAESLDRINTKLKENKSLKDATAEADRDNSREKLLALDKLAISEAESNLKKVSNGFNSNASAEAYAVLSRARLKLANDTKLAAAAEATLSEKAKENARLVEEEAKRRRKQDQDEPTSSLGGKVDKAGINDSYAAAIVKLNAQIKASKIDLQNFEANDNEKFKAGEIGKLQVIKDVAAKSAAEYATIGKAIQEQMDIASKGKNKKADLERFTGLKDQNDDAASQAAKRAALETVTYKTQLEDETNKAHVKSLEAEGKFVEAAAARWKDDYSGAYKSIKSDFDKYGDQFPVLGMRVKAFTKLQTEMFQDASMKEAVSNFDAIFNSISAGFKGVQALSEEEGLGAMFNAATEASQKYRAELPQLQAALLQLQTVANAPGASKDDAAKYQEELARQNGLADKYKTMWAGVGKSISDSLTSAFGDAGKATGTMVTALTKYATNDKKTTESRVKLYGDLAGAAKGYFKEGSTGYKALEKAEQVFRAIEIASQLKSLAMSLFVSSAKATGAVAGQATETAGVAAGEAARNLLKIPGVIMSFMSTLGPYGAVAAAVAIAAVLGGAFGGGGGGASSQTAEQRQKVQGTGTVLGDASAKSDSIQRSLDNIDKNSGLGLAHSASMDVSLKQLVAGIGNLSSVILRSTGESLTDFGTDSLGGAASFAKGFLHASSFSQKLTNSIFGGNTTVLDGGINVGKTSLGGAIDNGVSASKYTNTKKDGGWFSSDKYKTEMTALGGDVTSQFSLVIESLANTVTAAADQLGLGGDAFAARLKTFVIDIGNISLKDLTGDQIQEQLEAVFSKLGDEMAAFGVQGLDQFTKVGEGYLETLTRVANDYVQVSDVLAVLGKSFNTTGLGAVYLSESLIAAAGDLETLTTNTGYFVTNFLTEAERMKPITASVNAELSRLGQSTNLTMEQFKQLVLQQDLNTSSGQAMYVALLNIAPAFKEAADYAQDLADGTVSLTDAQQKALDKVDAARSALSDAYSNQSDDLKNSITKLKDFSASLKTFQEGLLTGANSPLTAAQKYAQAMANFDATSAAAKGGDATAQAGFQAAANELLTASKAYNASSAAYTADFNKVLSSTAALSEATAGQINVAQASLDALNAQVAGLITVNESVLSVTQAIANLQVAILTGKAQGLSDTQLGIDGSHAGGLDYVPKDGYIAKLHKGEKVLTASEASNYNKDSELVAEMQDMKSQLTDALQQLTAATVDSNYKSNMMASNAVVAGVDESVQKLCNKDKTSIKVNLG